METSVRPKVASPWDRAWARFIDAMVLTFVSIPVLVVLTNLDRHSWWPLSASLLWFVYDLVWTARSGQTYGKRRARVRVVDVDTGAVPSWWRSFLRASPMLLARIPYVGWLALALYLPMFWSPRRQGWHDRIANTAVVATPRA